MDRLIGRRLCSKRLLSHLDEAEIKNCWMSRNSAHRCRPRCECPTVAGRAGATCRKQAISLFDSALPQLEKPGRQCRGAKSSRTECRVCRPRRARVTGAGRVRRSLQAIALGSCPTGLKLARWALRMCESLGPMKAFLDSVDNPDTDAAGLAFAGKPAGLEPDVQNRRSSVPSSTARAGQHRRG